MTARLGVLVVLLAGAGIGLGVVASNGSSDIARLDAACNADAEAVQTAMDSYQAQTGTLPRTIADLTQAGQNGPWLRSAPYSPSYTLSITRNDEVIVHSKTGRGSGDWTQPGSMACNL